MVNKVLVYAGIGIFVFILMISILLSTGILNISGNKKNSNLNAELNKYRSSNIPEECRLPDYQNDVESWKEHLSHHQQTLYCLDYYK